jgi:hypothetical protein
MKWRTSLTVGVVPIVACGAWLGGAAAASGGHTMQAWQRRSGWLRRVTVPPVAAR